MIKKCLWLLFIVLAVVIGLYPGLYFIIDRRFGLLASKTPSLLASVYWNIGFYTHITLAGLALLIGWIQFSPAFRNNYLSLHRLIGKVYVASVLLSAPAGISIGFFATGGLITATGFITLGIVWFYSTLQGYLAIRKQNRLLHRAMMMYSYALTFAAVTLRLWLPLLMYFFRSFNPAYKVVAWLCWLPNLLVAYLMLRRNASLHTQQKTISPEIAPNHQTTRQENPRSS